MYRKTQLTTDWGGSLWRDGRVADYTRLENENTRNGIAGSNPALSDLYTKLYTMRQCVRCWLHLDKDQKLWCKKCRERVDEELRQARHKPELPHDILNTMKYTD